MKVTKRNGSTEAFDANKINKCVERACLNVDYVSASEIIRDAELQLVDLVKTKDIDQALIASAVGKIYKEPNYSYVAAQLLLQTILKDAFVVKGTDYDDSYLKSFMYNINLLVEQGLEDRRLLEYDLEHMASQLDLNRDYKFDYLGLQTVYDRYLIRDRKTQKVLETPQGFFMRVAMGLALNEENKEERALEFYDVISSFRALPSTPTLFNSGTNHPQLSSCFLSTVPDSLDGIFDSLWQQARKSKFAGGLGFDVTPLRAKGSYIKGTNGETSGCVSFLKLFNDMLVAVNQGGKRRGSGCAYMETWHLDIFDFLALRKNTGDDRFRTHDMNTANWIPDLFMHRVNEDGDWYLFSPNDVPELHDLVGDEFNLKYLDYCKLADQGYIKNYKVVKAKDLWKEMLRAIFETGHPWMTFKDPSNERYALKDVGVVHSSNLCTEILEHTVASEYDDGEKWKIGETAVCNLASINLKEHLTDNGNIDLSLLTKTIRTVIRMLDNVIDLNYYPTKEARNSNLRHRFIGMGSMGWQDLFFHMGVDYDSTEAAEISQALQCRISYDAIEASADLAKERGSFSTFEKSTWARGVLPQDTSTYLPFNVFDDAPLLRKKVKEGMRNACVMAIAPTATISYIAGCSQSIEPMFSTLFVYSTLSGDFTVINRWFVDDMKKLGLWDKAMADLVKSVNGDLSLLPDQVVPPHIKHKYRSAFDLDQHKLIDCAAMRQVYIDQGQSLNLYNKETSLKKLSDLYFHAWESELKTTYYLRNRGASHVEQSGMSKEEQQKLIDQKVNEYSPTEITCHGCE